MQALFLDVTAEQLAHNTTLQSFANLQQTDTNSKGRYIRVCLQDASVQTLKQMLARITIEESISWVLRTERHRLFSMREYVHDADLQEQIQTRFAQMMPKLELLMAHDIDRIVKFDDGQIPSWNIEGYLRFSAELLKREVKAILQETYQAYQNEQERAEFIALLQFCVAVQPCILEDVYLTLYADRFTMVDLWGNDLQQIYLEALPQEEYADVQMHDLILSILMTLLPKTIHLFIESTKITMAQREEQQKLIHLLQQVFEERLQIETGK